MIVSNRTPMLTKSTPLELCKLIITIALYTTLVTPAWAQADSLSYGKIEYARGDYQKALSYFDKTVSQQPNNATALYYRANTLIKLGLRTQALLDYQKAYQFADSPLMQDYCQTALSSLASNTGISALHNNSIPNQSIDQSKRLQISQSLGTIQLQSALDKVRIVDTSELLAQDYTMKQQIKLAEMHRETEKNLQDMRDASYYDQYGTKRQVYSSLQVQQYGEQRQQQEEALAQTIQKSVQGQTTLAQRRAQLTQQSAQNLESQLVGTSSPDGIKLDPLGTNLYVRNYDITKYPESLPKLPGELLVKVKPK